LGTLTFDNFRTQVERKAFGLFPMCLVKRWAVRPGVKCFFLPHPCLVWDSRKSNRVEEKTQSSSCQFDRVFFFVAEGSLYGWEL
jgi:hypothetical protein